MKAGIGSLVAFIAFSLIDGAALARCRSFDSPEQHLAEVDVIVVGTVVSASLLGDYPQAEGRPDLPAKAQLHVDGAIKGASAGEVLTVYYDRRGPDASGNPVVGPSLPYMLRRTDIGLEVSLCDRAAALSPENIEAYVALFRGTADEAATAYLDGLSRYFPRDEN